MYLLLCRDVSFNRLTGSLPRLRVTGQDGFINAETNYLSCELRVEATNVIAAPGNRLSALPASGPFDVSIVGPSVDSTSSVAFLWVGSVWQTWCWPILGFTLGFAALFATVAATGVIFLPAPPSLSTNLLPAAPAVQRGLPAVRTRLRRFVRFEPHRGVGVAQLWCAGQLAWLAVPCFAIVALHNGFALLDYFGPTYLYTCGEWVAKHLTMAYIKGPAAEWTLAFAACAFPCATARLVLRFQHMLHAEYTPPTHSPPKASKAAMRCMYRKYAVLIVICTLVPFAYAISNTVPGNNVSAAWILTLISESTSLTLSVITTLVIPWYCRYVSYRVYGAAGNPVLTSRLMQLARLWISMLAPALAVVLFNQDCLGGWTGFFWAQMDEIRFRFGPISRGWTPGHCSRGVIESLERLLLSKLAYSSFLVPAGVLLQHTRLWRRAKEAVVRRKPTYMAGFEVDSAFAAVLM
jgi:hypothetical protein